MSGHTKGQGVGWIHFADLRAEPAGDHFDQSKFLISDLQTWSWVFIVIAVVQLFAGIVVLRRMRAGRVPAIILAVICMVVWFVAWSVFPFRGLVMMALYGLIIYGLTAFHEYFE